MGFFRNVAKSFQVCRSYMENSSQQGMTAYGTDFRTFKHGAITRRYCRQLDFAMPIVGINALFERRGFKYIAIHAGLLDCLNLCLMGGILVSVCGHEQSWIIANTF
jgi:hypothetical protein